MKPRNTVLTREITYFEEPGSQNTSDTIDLAKKRAIDLGIDHVLVASTRGRTGVLAAEAFSGTGVNLVVVSEHSGFYEEGQQAMTEESHKRIQSLGAKVITQSHILSGVERSFSQRFGGASAVEIVAETLRKLMGVGVKVCVEITVMAADSGCIPCGPNVEIIAIAGTGGGADTAVVIRPAHMNNFLDLEIREIICMPRQKRANKDNSDS